jgi:Putative adhesin
MKPLVLLFALALTTGTATIAAADEWNRTFPATGRPDVRIETNDGRVNVTTWDKPEIAFHVSTAGWTLGEHLQVTAADDNGVISLVARVPSYFGMSFGNRWLHIDVSMPRNADLDVRTGDGSVSVEPVAGHIKLWTGDGHISAHGLKGRLDLHTGDGGIDAEDLDGQLAASSGDGHIRVHGRFDVLDLSSGDGGVTADAIPGSVMQGRWTLRTSDGGLTLRVPSDLKATLEAHTGDGHIHVALPVTVEGSWNLSHELRGTLNGGGPALELRSGDGSISVEKY